MSERAELPLVNETGAELPAGESEAVPEAVPKVRDRVVLQGLNGRPELNGRHGIALSWNEERGRFAVLVGEEKFTIKAENLSVATGPPKHNDDLYPGGIHYGMWETPETDPERVLIDAFLALYPTIRYIEGAGTTEDERVALLTTAGHAFFILTTTTMGFPAGYMIGDEDCGLEVEWKKILGWNSRYQMGGDVSDGDDGEDGEDAEYDDDEGNPETGA